MAFEEYQKPDEVKRQTSSAASLSFVIPLLLAFLVAVCGGTLLLNEYFPRWVSIVIALPVAVLLFVTIIRSFHDIVEVWVFSAIVIVLVFMLVGTMLNKKHHGKPVAAPPVPVHKQ